MYGIKKISEYNRRKIVFLGDSGVGKTSIILKKVYEKFEINQITTIGAAFSSYTIDDIKLELWDTAGQERYSSLIPMYYRGANCAIIVFDCTSIEKTWSVAMKWITRMEEEHIPYVLVANKVDRLEDRSILNDFMDNHTEYKFITTSAKYGENIDELFSEIVLRSNEHYKKNQNKYQNSEKWGIMREDNINKKNNCCY